MSGQRFARVAEPYRDGVAVEHERLRDGSVAWNVIMEWPELFRALRFACHSEKAARSLAGALREVSGIEVIS